MLEQFREEALNEHNRLRYIHQAEPLVLDDELCDIAQKHAEYLASENKLQHSSNKFEGKSLGENLAMYHHSQRDSYSGTEATNQWFKESSNYKYENAKYNSQSGHFTQIVWIDSKKVGFGIARSKNGAFYICANYFPAGNVLGRFNQNVKAPKAA